MSDAIDQFITGANTQVGIDPRRGPATKAGGATNEEASRSGSPVAANPQVGAAAGSGAGSESPHAAGRTTTYVGPAVDDGAAPGDSPEHKGLSRPAGCAGPAVATIGGIQPARPASSLTRAEKDELLRRIIMLLTAVALGFIFVAAARQVIKPIQLVDEPPVGRP